MPVNKHKNHPKSQKNSIKGRNSAPELSICAEQKELKVYGFNACQSLFRHRPEDIIKVYLKRELSSDLQSLLSFCKKTRLAYKVVENLDLEKVASTKHHQGVVIVAKSRPMLGVRELIKAMPKKNGAQVLLYLENIGNPHNLGAILRTGAHFNISGVIIAGCSGAEPSGAALMTAEGGYEALEIARSTNTASDLALLKAAGFKLIATDSNGRENLFKFNFPERSAILIGAENDGLEEKTLLAADHVLSIPGSGNVQSINAAAAAAITLAFAKIT